MIRVSKKRVFPREKGFYPFSPFSDTEVGQEAKKVTKGPPWVKRVIRVISIFIYIFTYISSILFSTFSLSSTPQNRVPYFGAGC